MTGWYKFRIKGAGAGGGAGVYSPTTAHSGYGGAEGGTTIAHEKLKKGDIVSIVIGIGGRGGTGNGGSGEAGGDSSVTCNSKTYIGGGGQRTWYGLGGTGTIPGEGPRDQDQTYLSGAPGRHGAGSGGGRGSYPGISATAGILGGGGGGGYGDYNGNYYSGAKGGDGVCWIEYYDPSTK